MDLVSVIQFMGAFWFRHYVGRWSRKQQWKPTLKIPKSITAENNVVKMAKDLVASAKRGFATSKVVKFPAKEEAVESFALAA